MTFDKKNIRTKFFRTKIFRQKSFGHFFSNRILLNEIIWNKIISNKRRSKELWCWVHDQAVCTESLHPSVCRSIAALFSVVPIHPCLLCRRSKSTFSKKFFFLREAGRVTRWVCEKIYQNAARPSLCRIYTQPLLWRKSGQKILGSFCNIKTAKKQSLNRQKFAQSVLSWHYVSLSKSKMSNDTMSKFKFKVTKCRDYQLAFPNET
jgi:hypothetical protein